MSTFKLACVQMDIAIGEASRNVAHVCKHLEETSANGAHLTIFPECTISGYCFDTLEETLEVAEPLDGPSVSAIIEKCRELQTTAIFGLLEKSEDAVYNTALCVDGSGIISVYHKVHLPTLGVDNFTTPGSGPFEVFEVKLGGTTVRIGMNICYDCSFPESARILTLKGADLIALPTNWPPGSGKVSDVIPDTRALENNVYFAAVNRIGDERGFSFIGKSKICDPLGKQLGFCAHSDEAIMYAEVDVEFARRKHLVAVPGKHEVHRIEDRRPETYSTLADIKKNS